MGKQGETNYLKRAGPEVAREALDKPFSEPACGQYLITLGQVLELLPRPPIKILDLGAGSGWTSVFLARSGYSVVGQDISPDMIALANKNKDEYRALSVMFLVQDFESMDYCEEFDCALFFDSLHHADNEKIALKRAYDALKPNGVCITVEPGVGHSKSPESMAVMQNWGVSEKDMPPAHIIRIAREIGYRSFQVYPRVTGPQPSCEARDLNLAAFSQPGIRRLIRSADEAVRYAARLVIKRINADFHYSNIVVLRK